MAGHVFPLREGRPLPPGPRPWSPNLHGPALSGDHALTAAPPSPMTTPSRGTAPHLAEEAWLTGR